MNEVRFVIIGVGNMGYDESKMIVAGDVARAKLVGVCDCDPKKIERAKKTFGESIRYFNSTEELFAEDDVCDAVMIATPHYDHPPIAIEAFKKGLHVLSEKPAGVYTKQVREMNEAAAACENQVFGIMYNQRTTASYVKLKELIASGELGEIRRINWIITTWYRSQAYYDSGTWRATWEGEGGGVLLNQCPHQLDLWQWITGMMPKRVRGFASYGKLHNIEVEDDVTVYAEYENGATGVFITSTGDTPGTNRLEITGDRGKIVVDEGKMMFYRNRVGEREYNRTTKEGFGKPECWIIEVPVEKPVGPVGHSGILTNFTNAILDGEQLIAPGEEGIKGLMISNAIHLSSWLDEWVELPLDENLYYEKLQEKINESKVIRSNQKKSKVVVHKK